MSMVKVLGEVFFRELGRKLREVRVQAGLKQEAVGLMLGFKSGSGQAYISRLESGNIQGVELGVVVRYLQACRAPVGRFVLKLAQSGAFGDAEDIKESVTGFTSLKQRSPQAPHPRGFAPEDGRSGAIRASFPVTPLGKELDVQTAFDRIEQLGCQRLVPDAVRKMREVVFERLKATVVR
jgi:transcriptional regulator with XRE-family HTH domain